MLFAGCLSLSVNADEPKVIIPSKTVLVIGDSLSAAFGIQEEDGWVSLLRHRLAQPYYKLKLANASVSGETSEGGLSRLQSLLDKYDPTIVILELGGNDGLRGLPLTLLQHNLDQMLTQILERKIKVLLIGMEIPPNYGKFYTQQFNDIYTTLAAKHKISLVPFLLEGIATQKELMQDDGIHPKANAQRQVLNNVWPHLKLLLPELKFK